MVIVSVMILDLNPIFSNFICSLVEDDSIMKFVQSELLKTIQQSNVKAAFQELVQGSAISATIAIVMPEAILMVIISLVVFIFASTQLFIISLTGHFGEFPCNYVQKWQSHQNFRRQGCRS